MANRFVLNEKSNHGKGAIAEIAADVAVGFAYEVYDMASLS